MPSTHHHKMRPVSVHHRPEISPSSLPNSYEPPLVESVANNSSAITLLPRVYVNSWGTELVKTPSLDQPGTSNSNSSSSTTAVGVLSRGETAAQPVTNRLVSLCFKYQSFCLQSIPTYRSVFVGTGTVPNF